MRGNDELDKEENMMPVVSFTNEEQSFLAGIGLKTLVKASMEETMASAYDFTDEEEVTEERAKEAQASAKTFVLTGKEIEALFNESQKCFGQDSIYVFKQKNNNGIGPVTSLKIMNKTGTILIDEDITDYDAW